MLQFPAQLRLHPGLLVEGQLSLAGDFPLGGEFAVEGLHLLRGPPLGVAALFLQLAALVLKSLAPARLSTQQLVLEPPRLQIRLRTAQLTLIEETQNTNYQLRRHRAQI